MEELNMKVLFTRIACFNRSLNSSSMWHALGLGSLSRKPSDDTKQILQDDWKTSKLTSYTPSSCVASCSVSCTVSTFISVDTNISYKIYKYRLHILKLKKTRHISTFIGSWSGVFVRRRWNCLYNMAPYFEYDYITCNIVLGIIYFVVQLSWY
jgi:hypothetical protein